MAQFQKVKRECLDNPKPMKFNISGDGRAKLHMIAEKEFCNNLSWAVETLINDKHREIID